MTGWVDRVLEWLLVIATGWLTLIYPLFRSKTGWDNPRVRHIQGILYMVRNEWLVRDNIAKWLKQRGEIFPAVVQVQTINRCNAQCGMCPYPYTTHLKPREIMTDELYTKLVTECVAEDEFKALVPMAKNEPLLDSKLEDRIAEFRRLARPHHLVEIVTNGSLLTPARLERLVRSGVDLLTISVSAFTEETYQKVMRGLSWQQVRQNLEALINSPALAQVNIYLRYIQQKENEQEFPAFRRYWEKRGLNVWGFEINNRAGTVRDYAAREPTKSFFLQRLRKAMGRHYMKKLCPHAFSLTHVLENGDVPMCTNDWDNREVLGNIRNQSLREIYNSPRMQAVRTLMHQGRYSEIPACQNCSFWKDWL